MFRLSLPSPLTASLYLTGLMCFLPFVNLHHRFPIPWFYSEWLAGICGLFALTPLLTTAFLKDNRIPQSALLFAGLAIILLIQALLGMLYSTRNALMVLSYLVWAGLLTVLGSYLRHALGWQKLATTLAWALTAAGVVNVMILVLQFVIRTGGAILFLPTLGNNGAMLQANHQADFCALAIVSLIYLYAKGYFSTSFFALLYALFLTALSFSGSRSAWLYLFTITVLAIALTYQQKARQAHDIQTTRSIIRPALLLLPAFTIVQLLLYYAIPNNLVNLPTERLLDSVTSSTPSARLHFWYDSLRLFLQSPWLGVGTGEFRLQSFLLLDKPSTLASNRVFEHAHNLFLHLAAEMGIFAVLMVLVSLIVWVRHFPWNKLNLENWWLISLLAALGIHSMLEYPLWYAYFLGIAAVLLGAGDEKLISIRLPALINKSSGIFSRQLAQCGLLLILLLGGLHIGTMLIANSKMERWVRQLTKDNASETSALDWTRQYSLFAPRAELLMVYVSPIDSRKLDQQLALNASAMHFLANPTVVYRYAVLLALKGDRAGAVKQFNRALLAYPNYYKNVLKKTPAAYRQLFIDLLFEARPAQRDQLQQSIMQPTSTRP